MVCNKLSKICFGSFSSDSISGRRNRFPHYKSIPSVIIQGTGNLKTAGSIELIRCLIKANHWLVVFRLSSIAIAVLPARSENQSFQLQQILELAEK